MTPDKAIKIQELYLHHSDQWNHQDLDTAIKLGIEALKRLQAGRNDPFSSWIKPLPGETKD